MEPISNFFVRSFEMRYFVHLLVGKELRRDVVGANYETLAELEREIAEEASKHDFGSCSKPIEILVEDANNQIVLRYPIPDE